MQKPADRLSGLLVFIVSRWAQTGLAGLLFYQSMRGVPEGAVTIQHDFSNLWGMAFHNTGRTILALLGCAAVAWVFAPKWWQKAVMAGRWSWSKVRRWVPERTHFVVAAPSLSPCLTADGEMLCTVQVALAGRGVAKGCHARIKSIETTEPPVPVLDLKQILPQHPANYLKWMDSDSESLTIPADGVPRTLVVATLRAEQSVVVNRAGIGTIFVASLPLGFPLIGSLARLTVSLFSHDPKHVQAEFVVAIRIRRNDKKELQFSAELEPPSKSPTWRVAVSSGTARASVTRTPPPPVLPPPEVPQDQQPSTPDPSTPPQPPG